MQGQRPLYLYDYCQPTDSHTAYQLHLVADANGGARFPYSHLHLECSLHSNHHRHSHKCRGFYDRYSYCRRGVLQNLPARAYAQLDSWFGVVLSATDDLDLAIQIERYE